MEAALLTVAMALQSMPRRKRHESDFALQSLQSMQSQKRHVFAVDPAEFAVDPSTAKGKCLHCGVEISLETFDIKINETCNSNEQSIA